LRRNCRPGYLLQWSNIAAAKAKGFRWYDTGGMPDDEQSEITEFKTRMHGAIVRFPGRFDVTAGKTPSRLFATAEHVYWR
jgi:lipid II:glycine glycyltransferase (peptidoglycan interpeptide bridge formation enzyme)